MTPDTLDASSDLLDGTPDSLDGTPDVLDGTPDSLDGSPDWVDIPADLLDTHAFTIKTRAEALAAWHIDVGISHSRVRTRQETFDSRHRTVVPPQKPLPALQMSQLVHTISFGVSQGSWFFLTRTRRRQADSNVAA